MHELKFSILLIKRKYFFGLVASEWSVSGGHQFLNLTRLLSKVSDFIVGFGQDTWPGWLPEGQFPGTPRVDFSFMGEAGKVGFLLSDESRLVRTTVHNRAKNPKNVHLPSRPVQRVELRPWEGAWWVNEDKNIIAVSKPQHCPGYPMLPPCF